MTEVRSRLLELTQGYRITQVLYATARLGIAEALAGGPRDALDVATMVGAHGPSVSRLLRALVPLGLVVLDDDGRYRLTEAGTLLDGRIAGSVRAGILFEGAILYEHWAELVDSIRTGQNVYQRRHGVDAWAYRDTKPEMAQLFDAAMQEFSTARVNAVVAAYDFAGLDTIVDVGGGRGSLLAGILKAHPAARGVLLDQPAVVAGASAVLEAAGVAQRCTVVGGNSSSGFPREATPTSSR